MDSDRTSIAKLSRPKLSAVFPRKRLFKELDSSKKKQIIWIVGPAGSGKTTLAASYLDAHATSCLWYQLDEGDTDIASFFYYLGLAAQKAAPRYKKPLPLLTPEYMPGISVFVRKYFEELFARCKPPFAIVFDNYHDVLTDSMFHNLFLSALSRVPEGVRVFVLSRTDPPAAFMRLRANNSMHVLGWNELRFTLDETKKIVLMKEKRKLNGNTLALLHKKTEGWVAGLVLLIESIKLRSLDYQLLDRLTFQDIFEYFVSEIFKKADTETRFFLLSTAWLPIMTGDTAQELTGIKTARKILSNLYANNIFIEKHQNPDPAYHYHPLFREFLLSLAQQTYTPEQLSEIRQRAASLMMEAGHVEYAVALLIDAKDWNKLVPVVLDYAQVLVNQGRSKTLLEWLMSVPDAVTGDTPALLYWRGICSLPASPVESRRCFERAFLLFEADGNKAGALSSWSGAVDTFLLEHDDFRPLDTWIDWLDKCVDEKWVFPSVQIETRVASSMAGALVWRRPDHPHIGQWVDRAVLLSKMSRNSSQGLQAYQLVSYFILMGKYDECGMFLKEMNQKSVLQELSPLETISLKMTEMNLYKSSEESRTTGARTIADCIELAQEAGLPMLIPMLFAHAVYIYLNAGEAQAAGRFLAELEKTVGNGRRLHTAHYYHVAGWYHQFIGDFRQSIVFEKKALGLAEESGTPFPAAYIQLALALALHENGDYAEASKHLDAAREMGRRTGSGYLRFLTLLAKAHFAFDKKKEENGFEALREAMACGRQNDYTPMVNFWRPVLVSRICRKALEADIEREYVYKLIQRLALVPDVPLCEAKRWPREISITTFGDFNVARDGKSLQFGAKAPRKLLAVLKGLVACGPKGAGEEELADMLWPEAGGDAALQSLDTSLHRLRQLLKSDGVIQLREGRIRFDAQRCWVDAHAFEELLGFAQKRFELPGHRNSDYDGTASDELHILERAVELYTGAFLEKATEPWALAYRERLRTKYLKAVQRLGQYYEQNGKFEHAIAWYEKGLEVDDVAEPFYQSLMKCYGNIGRTAEAVTLYQRCRRTLQAVLKIDPSPETEELFKSLNVR